jgi:hypothetical protein
MEPVEVRIATNEAIFRRVNEEIAAAPGRFDSAEFVCECGEPDCHEQISLPLVRYKEIRTDDLVFFVMPGHEAPKAEKVIERHEDYLLVRKGEETRPVLEQFE